ncbi:MAG: hypothetical protein IJJ45_01575 [Clostridia bacterium]|nr:hypothetical protein [Clostridia bacterium]
MSQPAVFPHRVTQSDDGTYCWTYDLKAHRNFAQLTFMAKLLAAIFVPVALILLCLTWSYGAIQALLFCIAMPAVVILLPVLIWWWLPPDPSYLMTESRIESWPKGRGNNVFLFSDVRHVRFRRDIDRIELRFVIGALHVYVPPEDYDLVKDLIIDRVPEHTATTHD